MGRFVKPAQCSGTTPFRIATPSIALVRRRPHPLNYGDCYVPRGRRDSFGYKAQPMWFSNSIPEGSNGEWFGNRSECLHGTFSTSSATFRTRGGGTARRRKVDATQGGVGRPADTSRSRWLPAFLCGVLVVGVLGGVFLQVGSAEASTTAWSVVASPNPSAGGIFLNGVSCVGSKWCMAVGATSTGTLAESFNGSKWLTVRSPNPAGGTIPSLNGVSCISTSHCTAVGSSDIPGGVETLVETWNGAVWKIVSSPNGVGGRDGLNGVSCPASNRCTAVGYQALGGHNDETLAEFWNGSDWKIVPTPSPSKIRVSPVRTSRASRAWVHETARRRVAPKSVRSSRTGMEQSGPLPTALRWLPLETRWISRARARTVALPWVGPLSNPGMGLTGRKRPPPRAGTIQAWKVSRASEPPCARRWGRCSMGPTSRPWSNHGTVIPGRSYPAPTRAEVRRVCCKTSPVMWPMSAPQSDTPHMARHRTAWSRAAPPRNRDLSPDAHERALPWVLRGSTCATGSVGRRCARTWSSCRRTALGGRGRSRPENPSTRCRSGRRAPSTPSRPSSGGETEMKDLRTNLVVTVQQMATRHRVHTGREDSGWQGGVIGSHLASSESTPSRSGLARAAFLRGVRRAVQVHQAVPRRGPGSAVRSSCFRGEREHQQGNGDPSQRTDQVVDGNNQQNSRNQEPAQKDLDGNKGHGVSDPQMEERLRRSGYLTRRLVDVAQEMVVNLEDCGTVNGITVSAITEGDELVAVSLKERIVGRVALDKNLTWSRINKW